MGAFRCPTCGNQRSGHKNSDCSICWLIKDFKEEHTDGQHKGKAVHGCPECQPVLARQIARRAREVRRASDDTMRKAQARMDEMSVFYSNGTRTSTTTKTPTQSVGMSHSSCDHEKTPKDRAKCRAQRRAQ